MEDFFCYFRGEDGLIILISPHIGECDIIREWKIVKWEMKKIFNNWKKYLIIGLRR